MVSEGVRDVNGTTTPTLKTVPGGREGTRFQLMLATSGLCWSQRRAANQAVVPGITRG
jgi:hypothetical protein